jgi:hypothetical protein
LVNNCEAIKITTSIKNNCNHKSNMLRASIVLVGM